MVAALYYLAYRGDRVARDELLALSWPDSDEGRARASLRQLIAALRASPLAVGLEVDARVAENDERAALRLLGVGLDAEPLDEGTLARYLELASSCGWAEEAEERSVEFERGLVRARWRAVAAKR